jgi:DNA polymerase
VSTNWAELASQIRGCVACTELAATRTCVVVGAPPTATSLMLVGEAPGAAEDATGLPFVGRAGALLDELLTDAGLSRDAVGVVNVLKCRPPGNRTPTRPEVANCRRWLDQQIRLTSPTVVVTLGATATAWAFARQTTVAGVRGRAHPLAGHPATVVVPTYHPSAALRFGPNGEPRRLLGEDLAFAASLVTTRGA